MYPLFHIEDLLEHLVGAMCYFTKIDLLVEYYQVCTNASDNQETTFKTKFGLYKCKVMPMWDLNA